MSKYAAPIQKFLQLGAHMLASEAADRYAPKVTQNLARDIQVFPQTKPNEISVGNSSLIDYAIFVHYGTKPHVIKPKKSNPRQIINKKGRKQIVTNSLKIGERYFKQINHPGTKANPYLDNALKNLVRSGKLERLLGGFSDEMSEEMFENITKGLRNIKVK